MPFMVWNDKLSVGVKAVDDDHKKLVGMLNELYDAILAGRGQEVCADMLHRVAEYTGDHFAQEERLFAKISYAGAEQHIRQHRDITADLMTMMHRHQAGMLAAPSLKLMNALKDELFDHILGSDKLYEEHLTAMGIG